MTTPKLEQPALNVVGNDSDGAPIFEFDGKRFFFLGRTANREKIWQTKEQRPSRLRFARDNSEVTYERFPRAEVAAKAVRDE